MAETCLSLESVQAGATQGWGAQVQYTFERCLGLAGGLPIKALPTCVTWRHLDFRVRQVLTNRTWLHSCKRHQKAVSVKNWLVVQQASKTNVSWRRFSFQSVHKPKKNFSAFQFDFRGLGLISRSLQETFDRRCLMQWRGKRVVQICSMNTVLFHQSPGCLLHFLEFHER